MIAAGNDSIAPRRVLRRARRVVTATTRADTRASYSNTSSGLLRAARWPVAAPGGEAETDPDDCATGGTPKGILSIGYWCARRSQPDGTRAWPGTRWAAPHVGRRPLKRPVSSLQAPAFGSIPRPSGMST